MCGKMIECPFAHILFEYEQHFWIQKVDDLCSTQDSYVLASFEKQSRASSKDTNSIEDELDTQEI